MAGAAMKDIKLRIKSVESTMQITKAMELVASSKLRKAKERVEHSRPYFTTLQKTLTDIAANNTEFTSPYVQERPVNKVCYVIIAGDRGLAGGYNNNMFKAVAAHMQENGSKPMCVLPIGKKAVDYCERRKMEILSREFAVAEDISISDCFEAARLLTNCYLEDQFDELYVGYTKFVSMLTQTPDVIKTLPLHLEEPAEKNQASRMMTLYEPSSEVVFNTIVPEYVSGIVYGALSESWASELGARRTAMDAASKNAGEMIEDLSLKYNRARQGAITQEITEIVAGSEGN